MLKKTIIFFLVGVVSGFLIADLVAPSFEDLSADEMHQRVIKERDLAIKLAKENGNYRCCINPPCTMCYMEANQWNNHVAGTCVCDDLIAQGKDPCPQCINGLCEEDEEVGICEIN